MRGEAGEEKKREEEEEEEVWRRVDDIVTSQNASLLRVRQRKENNCAQLAQLSWLS